MGPKHRTHAGVFAFAERHEYWVAALAYSLILVALLAPFFFQGKIFAAADFQMTSAPWKFYRPVTDTPANHIRSDDGLSEYPRKLLLNGMARKGRSIPFWDPYKLGGYPFYEGVSQSGIFTPLNIWLLLIPPAVFTGLFAFARLLLAGFATYVFGRVLRVGKPGAFIAGVIFMLSGPLIVWLTSVLVDIAWAYPALLACVEGFISDWRKRWALAIPAIVGWMLMLGYPPGAVHLALVVSAYTLVRLWQTRAQGSRASWARLGWLAGSAALGVGIGSLGIHTALTFLALSPHAVRHAAITRLPGIAAAMFAYPNMYGNQGWSATALRLPTLPVWGGPMNYCEATAYVGLMPLVLVPIGVWRHRDKPTVRLLVAMAAVLIAVIYSNPIPINKVLAAIPVVQAVVQTRLLVPLALVLAVLAGFGIDALVRAQGARVSRRAAAITTAVGLGAFALVSLLNAVVTRGVVAEQVDADVPKTAYQLAYVAYQARERVTVPLLVLGLVVVLWAVARYWVPRRAAIGLILAFVLLDAGLFGYGWNPMLAKSEVLPGTPSIYKLRALSRGWRIAPVGGWAVLGFADISTAYRIESINGYDMSAISPLTAMFAKVDPDFFHGTSSRGSFLGDEARLPSPILDALGVRYLVTDPDEPAARNLLARAGYRPVFSRDIIVFENPRALPRAWSVAKVRGFKKREDQLPIVQDPKWMPAELAASEAQYEGTYSPATVEATSPAAGRTELSVESTGTAFVVVSEMAIPQWRAEIDGRRVPVAATDYGLLGVVVPKGAHSVRLWYESPGFREWAWVSLFFLALWIATVLGFVLGRPVRSTRANSR